MSQRSEMQDVWRAAMSAVGSGERASGRRRGPLSAGLFRETSPETGADGLVELAARLERLQDQVERLERLVRRFERALPEAPVTPGFVVVLPGEDSYRIREAAAGACPEVGDQLDEEGRSYVVLKVGSSPFPNDLRRCAYLERCGPLDRLDA